MNSYSELWDAICLQMRENKYITEPGYNMWLKDSYILDFKEGIMYLSVPTTFHKDIVENTYKGKLTECIGQIMGTIVDLEFVVNQNDTRGIDDQMELETPAPVSSLIGAEFTFENFVLGSSNRYAQAAAMSVAENPASLYNPLLIYGASGVGKTHLMFAIRNRIAKLFPNKKIEYIRCEDFANMFFESLQAQTMNLFHNRFRSVDVLLIDDIQFIGGKLQMQEEVFNTFNALLQSKKQIVLTSDRAPKDINDMDIRLKSRFENGLMADISAPDLETRIGIIKIKANTLGISLNDDMIYYIADQIKTNTRQIEGIINQIKAYINLHNTMPSISIVQNYIQNIVSDARPDPINTDRVISEVSRYLKVSEADIRSKKRMADIVWARHVSIYITSKITSISNMQISKEFKMDHATIGHALKKVEDRMQTDSFEKNRVQEIIDALQR